MRRLIVQADDFGMTEGVTLGILEAMDRGIVTGAGAMVCGQDWRERVARLAPLAGNRLGLHLQLTDGVPICRPEEIPSLVDATGRFPRYRRQLGVLDTGEILREWRAQLAALRELGVEPNRLDTHHSVHALPEVLPAYRELARETGLPVRGSAFDFNRALLREGIPCSHQYSCIWTGKPVRAETLTRTLRALAYCTQEGDFVEIGCHPAHVDESLLRLSDYAEQRADELAVLCDPALRESIAALGFELCGSESLGLRPTGFNF